MCGKMPEINLDTRDIKVPRQWRLFSQHESASFVNQVTNITCTFHIVKILFQLMMLLILKANILTRSFHKTMI